MIIDAIFAPAHSAYFSGKTTIRNDPASVDIFVFRHDVVVARAVSDAKGNYWVGYLEPGREYLLLGRDPKTDLEPDAYDYIKPADNRTLAEQAEMIAAWT